MVERLPICERLRNDGWTASSSGEESRTPYEAADTIEALYEAAQELLDAFDDGCDLLPYENGLRAALESARK